MLPETEITHCLRREVEELKASAASVDSVARDEHFAMAERYVDRAWSLQEARSRASKVVALSGELKNAFGFDALEVALDQSAAAVGEGSGLWHDIVVHLSADGLELS